MKPIDFKKTRILLSSAFFSSIYLSWIIVYMMYPTQLILF